MSQVGILMVENDVVSTAQRVELHQRLGLGLVLTGSPSVTDSSFGFCLFITLSLCDRVSHSQDCP